MSPKSTKKVTLKKPNIRPSSQAAAKKPIISLGALITLVIFAGLVLGIILLNRQKETTAANATPTKGTTFVFGANVGEPTSIEIKPKEGDALKIARNDKNAWAIEVPQKAEADQGAAESAATQVGALQVVQTIPAGANPSDFGFDAPAYVITLKFKDKERVLEVGDQTPSENGYYVRVDKGGDILVADLSGIESLTQLVTMPPYLYTPTPSATATDTALPPSATPTQAATSLPVTGTPATATPAPTSDATTAPAASVTPTP